MNERAKGPDSEDATVKGQIRKLLKRFHADRSNMKGKDVETIAQILGQCVDASKKKNFDSWPKGFTYNNEFITLVSDSPDGVVKRSDRAVRVPRSPREFVKVLQGFVDTGVLPPESPQDRQDRERADATAARRQRGPSYADPNATYSARNRQQQGRGPRGDYGAWEQQQEEAQRRAQEEAQRRQEEEHSTWRKWQQERAERARRQQEEAARQAQEDAARRKAKEAERRFRENVEKEARERAERARRAREEAQRRVDEEAQVKAAEEAERKAQEEANRRERETREAAEREARRPENLFTRRIAEAQTLDDFRGIVKDMDNAFENQSVRGPDHAFAKDAYDNLRFIEMPGRVAEMFRAEIANAEKPDEFQKVFRDIVQDGFFRDASARETLSGQGEVLLSEVSGHAELYFKNAIREAKFRSELADIGKQIERFFGGTLSEARIFDPVLGRRAPLSQVERSTMTREQIKRYGAGDTAPRFAGPLSDEQKVEISRDSKISFTGPLPKDSAKIVADLSDAIDEQVERLQKARLAATRRAV